MDNEMQEINLEIDGGATCNDWIKLQSVGIEPSGEYWQIKERSCAPMKT